MVLRHFNDTQELCWIKNSIFIPCLSKQQSIEKCSNNESRRFSLWRKEISILTGLILTSNTELLFFIFSSQCLSPFLFNATFVSVPLNKNIKCGLLCSQGMQPGLAKGRCFFSSYVAKYNWICNEITSILIHIWTLWFHILHVFFSPHYFIQRFPFKQHEIATLSRKKKNPAEKQYFMHYLYCELFMKWCLFLCSVDYLHHIAY